jgi:protein O-GlcNAc transferase
LSASGDRVTGPETRRTSADLRRAFALHQAGRLDEAVAIYLRILAIEPRNAPCLHLLGLAFHAFGRNDEAERSIRAAIDAKPDVAAYHVNLGMVLRALSRLHEAESACRMALALAPDNANARNNLGNVLRDLGQFEAAYAQFDEALKQQPDDVNFLANAADLLQLLDRHAEAVEIYDAILRIAPANLRALRSKAAAMFNLGDANASIEYSRQALEIDPHDCASRKNLGIALQVQARHVEALAVFDALCADDPEDLAVQSMRLVAQHYAPHVSNAEMRAAAAAFAEIVDASAHVAEHANAPDPDRKLRIGLFSGFFGSDAVGIFLASLLPRIDRSKFRIVCYAVKTGDDWLAAELRAASDVWRSIAGIDDREAAALVRQDEIDILVDLTGHNIRNRLGLFAWRAAPVQAAWIGYYGTTGLSQIDAILLDEATLPPGNEDFFVERVVRLPGGRFCYTPPPYAPPVRPPPHRAERPFAFGSFNNLAKLNDDVVAVWARILAAAPDARLILKWETLGFAAERARVAALFAKHAIASARLELRGASAHPQMLEEYGDIDLALDPFPFCGGLTSCEAFWMGVPVLTLPQQRPVSRQTLAFLRELGLEHEFAAVSAEDYVARAVAFARDSAPLAALRPVLRARMQASNICDAERHAVALQDVLRDLWRDWCRKDRRTLLS